MNSRIASEMRDAVARRAGGRCEYCLIREDDTFFGCEVDHIVAVKHGGTTTFENLAYACQPCNRHKGTDLGSLSRDGSLARFFNPRTDEWSEHFRVDNSQIVARTEIGEVTARVLGFNAPERALERRELMQSGRYP